MAMTRKDEERLLTSDENTLVAQSHQPELGALPDHELANIEKLLRERRDRAQSLANKARREMRGKKPAASPPRDDTGSRLKAAALAAAVRRINKERERRRVRTAREELIANAERAFSLKTQSARPDRPSPGRTAGRGMRKVENQRADRIGSAMEAGRVSQFVKNAQAGRDSR